MERGAESFRDAHESPDIEAGPTRAEPVNTFGEAVRAQRIRAGLTQAELAKRAGVSVRALRYIEQGRVSRPRRDSVRRLAEAVGLPADRHWSAWTGRQADGRLRIGVLGRLELRGGWRPVEMGPAKQRSVLALLALQPGKVVHREEIIDVLWGNRPPESCQNLVHTYISRLRKAAEAVRPGSDAALISSARGGYRLTVDVEQLDLLQFDELAAQAGRLRGTDAESALVCYDKALRLWRGPVLADLPDEVRRHPVAMAASGRRIAAALAYADIALGLGRHEPVVEALRALVHDEPLHEGLHARLMLGFAGSGQQAAALRLFAEIRGRLADDLGIEPGAEIMAAHLRIIRNEVAATGAAARPGQGHPVPAQLPADIGGFTGREEHLGRLDAVLPKRGETRAAVTICAIAGTAGVGKTALAVHWAHRVRDKFPDGQLYVNLRGYASDSPVRPLEALTRFLHALGLPGERVPADEEEAVGLYRTMLADRRALILLDNAARADQVRPLLPGSRGCLVLITSRDRLTSLAATEGAYRLGLDVLEPSDARALLSRMIGEVRSGDEPDAVAELAEVCAYLPLALRIVAANLAALPHTSAADYTDELRKRGRLAELVVDGDEGSAVRAAFDLSYDTLEPRARQLFRLLGLVPGGDFTAEAGAALLAGDLPDARRLVGQLAGAHLVAEHAAGRYQFHDLLREYAADRAAEQDGPEETRAATERLFAYYLGVADAATRVLYPHALRMPATPVAGQVPPATEAAAIAWLDAELPNLVAVARACPAPLVRYSWQLVDSLRGYFNTRGHGAEGLAMCRIALAAAVQEGDPAAEASVNDVMGLIQYNLSDYAKATAHHSRALALNRRIGNAVGEATSLHNLGRVHSQLGRPTQASLYYEQALTINRRIGNRHGEATNLNYVGVAWLSRGRPDRAIAHHTQALALSKEIGSRTVEFSSLNGLGLAHWARGELDLAVRSHMECLSVCEQIGHRIGEVNTLVCLAETNCDAGRYQEAFVQAQTSIRQSRQLGERRHEVGGLDVLATVHLRRGHYEVAIPFYADALQIAREIGFGFGETSVLIGLAGSLRCADRSVEAIAHCHDALAVLHDSGMRLLEGRALTELAHAHLSLGSLEDALRTAERAVKVTHDRRQRLAEARALTVLGLAHRASGDPAATTTAWRAALEIFTMIGTPEANELRDRLEIRSESSPIAIDPA